MMHLHHSSPMEAQEIYTLLDTAGDAAFAVGPNGHICYWSQKAEELLGFSQEQVLSKNCDQILAGEDEGGHGICCGDCRILEIARKRGEVPAYDLRALTAGGERKWLNISIIVAHLNRGPSPLVVHLMRDIEDRKKLESLTKEIMVRVGDLTGAQADQALARGSSQPPPVDLSPRELSILRQLSLGNSTEDIAARLHISTATVRNHIQHILTKLRCHTRLEAVILAARQGLI